MFRDARELRPEETLNANVCVVGGGPAGITFARALSGSGLSVLLLESGGLEPDVKTQNLSQGGVEGWLSASSNYLVETRARCLGGCTSHWTGTCGRLSESQFHTRQWLSIPGWPIEFSELDRFYEQAASICEIQALPTSTSENPFALEAQDYEVQAFHRSPPTHFGRRYEADLRASAETTVVLHAIVTELLPDPLSGRLTTALISTIEGPRNIRLNADVFVLAAGAIENARLLLTSNSVFPNGLGASDKAGQYFMDHPYLTFGSIFFSSSDKFSLWQDSGGSLVSDRKFKVLNTSVQYQKRNQSLAMRFHISPPRSEVLNSLVLDSLTPTGLIDVACHESGNGRPRQAGSWATLSCALEPLPQSSSLLTLSQEKDLFGVPQVKLISRLCPTDLNSLTKGIIDFIGRMSRRGMARVRPESGIFRELLDSNLNVLRLRRGAHHIGTTRMAGSPQDGVVDSNCRVFGFKNLFVAGSSVFPNSGTSNPTLTIVALALRLAEHIRREYGSVGSAALFRNEKPNPKRPMNI